MRRLEGRSGRREARRRRKRGPSVLAGVAPNPTATATRPTAAVAMTVMAAAVIAAVARRLMAASW